MLSNLPMSYCLIGCRLCLCTEPQRNYFSLESSEKFLAVKIALSLEADFGKLGIYPNHICQNCQDILGKFKEVKTIAHANEPFILQCQDTIWNYGLEEAKEIYDNKATLQEVPDEVNLIEDFSTHIENQTVESLKVLAKDIAVENMEMLNEYGNDAYEAAKDDEEHEKRTDNTEPYSDKVWDHQTIQTTVKYDRYLKMGRL